MVSEESTDSESGTINGMEPAIADGLATGATVGIVVAVILLMICIIVVVVLLYRRHKRQNDDSVPTAVTFDDDWTPAPAGQSPREQLYAGVGNALSPANYGLAQITTPTPAADVKYEPFPDHLAPDNKYVALPREAANSSVVYTSMPDLDSTI